MISINVELFKEKTMKLTKKQAWPIVSRVFPEYKGRKFTLEYGDNVTFWDLNWSGGSRTY